MIRRAVRSDVPEIRELYSASGRPSRPVLRVTEYYVAVIGTRIAGCAAVRRVQYGGYLYGLAVHPDFRRRGIGSALTRLRLRKLRQEGGAGAIVLAMFWNVRFFRRLGFKLIKRESLPWPWRRIADLRSPIYRHSAVLWHGLE